jgi:pimeloyl-ACP methyl ester carboxylesterase
MTTWTNCGTAYDLLGPSDAPAIALIHGLGATRQLWERYVPALSQRFRVVNYDLRGHGESKLPHETPSLAMCAEQLKLLLDELQIDRCAVLGFSIGGMINRRFAMDYPNRVSALVILNSPHERGETAQRLVETRAVESGHSGPGANLDETIARWFTPEFRAQQPQTIDTIRNIVLANDPHNYAGFRFVLAAGVVELIRPDPPITAPTLIMTCENDTGSNPAMSLAIASEIDGARAIIVPRLQHMGLIEAPESFLEPIESFLDEALR